MQQRIMELLGEVANEEITSEFGLLFLLLLFVGLFVCCLFFSFFWGGGMFLTTFIVSVFIFIWYCFKCQGKTSHDFT